GLPLSSPRTTARTDWPASSSAFATAPPTFPVIPVTAYIMASSIWVADADRAGSPSVAERVSEGFSNCWFRSFRLSPSGLALLSPGKRSVVAVDKAQARFPAIALDAIDHEWDAFFDREAGVGAPHFGAHPTGCDKQHGAAVALVTSSEAFHQHVEGRFAGAV